MTTIQEMLAATQADLAKIKVCPTCYRPLEVA
jgi:hypothetical protein